MLQSLYDAVYPAAPSLAEIGTASVHYGRMVAIDSAFDMEWDDDVPVDGLADVVFWSRHESEVAAEVGARPMLWSGERAFGWRGIPLAAAEKLARDLEGMRSQEKAFAVDLRPHTEQWRFLEDLRRSQTRSIQIDQDGSRSTMFDAGSGHHLCFIGADLDAAGGLLRVIVDLGRDPFA